MNPQTKHLLEIFNQKRFSKIEGIPNEKMLKVDSEVVTRVIKKNYSYLTCTCESSGKTGHNSLCRHKQFFIIFPILEYFNKHLDKLIKDYEGFLYIKGKLEPYAFVNDLKNLRRSLK